MSLTPTPVAVDFESRLRRSRGRGARAFSVTSRVTEEELLSVERAASNSGKAVGEWAREVLIDAARQTGPDVVLVELVATRMLLVNMVKMLGQSLPITEAEYAKLNTQVQTAKRRVASELADQTKRLNTGKES
jgi:hypothetical protein